MGKHAQQHCKDVLKILDLSSCQLLVNADTRCRQTVFHSGSSSSCANIVRTHLSSSLSGVVHVCVAHICSPFHQCIILHVFGLKACEKMSAFWLLASLSCIFLNVCTCVWIESSAAPGKGMAAQWQMVGINLAKSLFLSMSMPPTRLPALPRLYFPPRSHFAQYLLRRISLPTSKLSLKLAVHQVVQGQVTSAPAGFRPRQCYFFLCLHG